MSLPKLFDNRKRFLNSLYDFINSQKINDSTLENELNSSTKVISIDADWGYGKTTFMKYLENKLTENDFIVLNFNAWINDYEKDPLSIFIKELMPQIIKANKEDFNEIKQYTDKIKTFLSVANNVIALTTRAFPQIPELDIVNFIEKIKKDKEKILSSDSETIKISIEETGTKKLQNDFIEALKSITPESNKKIIILIDELDRCRPNFAIELLERIKHFFDLDQYLFILTICRKQLKESVKQIYGNGFEDTGYFRRFFDYEFYLPAPNRNEFIKNSFKNNNNGSISIEQQIMTTLAKIKTLSLRDLNNAINFINLVITFNKENFSKYSKQKQFYLAFGIVLRFADKILFEDFIGNNKINSGHKYNVGSFLFLLEIYKQDYNNNSNTWENKKTVPILNWLGLMTKATKIEETYDFKRTEKYTLDIVSTDFSFSFYKTNTEYIFSEKSFIKQELDNLLLFGVNQFYISENKSN